MQPCAPLMILGNENMHTQTWIFHYTHIAHSYINSTEWSCFFETQYSRNDCVPTTVCAYKTKSQKSCLLESRHRRCVPALVVQGSISYYVMCILMCFSCWSLPTGWQRTHLLDKYSLVKDLDFCLLFVIFPKHLTPLVLSKYVHPLNGFCWQDLTSTSMNVILMSNFIFNISFSINKLHSTCFCDYRLFKLTVPWETSIPLRTWQNSEGLRTEVIPSSYNCLEMQGNLYHRPCCSYHCSCWYEMQFCFLLHALLSNHHKYSPG